MVRQNRPLRKTFATEWFKDAKTPEEKEQRVQMLMSASLVLELLAQILKDRKDKLDNTFDYGPEWQYKVPKDFGRKEELTYALKLLTPIIEQQE